ncbi:MAG: hypothetical protein M1829_005002 [Trizodia sp. TS-e1964]|nr:MAG: hypothetical protein M1829_005002 [Trizodia sp. TS-e1964]
MSGLPTAILLPEKRGILCNDISPESSAAHFLRARTVESRTAVARAWPPPGLVEMQLKGGRKAAERGSVSACRWHIACYRRQMEVLFGARGCSRDISWPPRPWGSVSLEPPSIIKTAPRPAQHHSVPRKHQDLQTGLIIASFLPLSRYGPRQVVLAGVLALALWLLAVTKDMCCEEDK